MADALVKSGERDAAGLVAKAETDTAAKRRAAAADSAKTLRAARLEAYALFVKGLDALQHGDERMASVRFRRALRADPFFGRVEGVPEALATFLRENPGVPRDSEALQVLSSIAEFRAVLAGD